MKLRTYGLIAALLMPTGALAKPASEFLREMSASLAASLAVKPTPASPSVFCQIWGIAPDYYPWVLKSSDVDGPYVVLKYTYDQAPANLPKNIVFAWHRDGLYAPWIVYYTNEPISDEIRVSPNGDVAFWRTEPASSSNPIAQTELRVCKLDPTQLASQLDAYSCSSDIRTGDIADTVPHNATTPTLFGVLTNQPDGKFINLDWNGDHLFFTRYRHTNLSLSLESWSTVSQSLTNLAMLTTTSSSPGELLLQQVDATGSIGYSHFNITGLFTGSAGMTVMGAAPTQGPSGPVYNGSTVSEIQTGYFGSFKASAFISMGGERHLLFASAPMASSLGNVAVRSSADNYQTQQNAIVLPAGQTKAFKPLRVSSSVFGELLVMQTTDANQGSQIDVYQYSPSGIPGLLGAFTHLETITPPAPFTRMGLLSATDVPLWGAAMLDLYVSSTSPAQHALLRCL